MNSSEVKKWLYLHTWTGLVAGMALFIAFYAGSLTVFFHELEVWDSYRLDPVMEQSYDDAQILFDRVIQQDPLAKPNMRLYPSRPGHPENIVRWYERLENGNYEPHEYRLSEETKLNDAVDNAHLASFIYRLHYTAGLPSSFGIYALGIICLIYGMALVSGVLIFIPNFLKDLFIVRGGRNKKRFWLDAHNVVGVLSLPWHIMFAWSSVVLCIGVFFLMPFQFLVFDEDVQKIFGSELGRAPSLNASGDSASVLPVAEIIRVANKSAPGISPTQLRYTNVGDRNGMVVVYGTVDSSTLSTNANVSMNSVTGEVLHVSHPESASPGATFYNGLIALHYVSFGGLVAKWIYFLLGLLGAFMFYTGNLLWIETRRKRRQFQQPKWSLFLARLNSGVCIGCMAGISFAFLVSRAFSEFENRGELTELAYFLVFFGAIVWSYIRPVALGTRDLLFVCALGTGLIPVFDGVFIDLPIWLSLAKGDWILFLVDALAVVGSIIFWQMGRGVAKRARSSDRNSVWSYPVDSADESAVIRKPTFS